MASLLGVGYSPIAPGTAGTLATIPIYLGLVRLGGDGMYVAATLAVLVVGVIATDHATAELVDHDPGWVVIDESVGLLVTMTFLPAEPRMIILGLLLFRAFDILKPLGIRKLEELPGGLGVMLDDFAAGVLANLVLQVAALLPIALHS